MRAWNTAKKIYARAISLEQQGPVPTGKPYMVIRFPEGFTSNVAQEDRLSGHEIEGR
jgi:hypothetical protein